MFVEHLNPNNLFRPKVLAKVQRNGIWFVGSSISVSNFLRPIYLRNRILTFKRKLLKAMINPDDDSITDSEGFRWTSLAFYVKRLRQLKDSRLCLNCKRVLEEFENETNLCYECLRKPPCNNCRHVFRNLHGFISTNDNQYDSRTFLGACAEYLPVNLLLPDDADTLSDQDTELIRVALTRNERQCSAFFRSFERIRTTCEEAYGKYIDSERTQTEHLKEVYQDIRPALHILGYLPGCRL